MSRELTSYKVNGLNEQLRVVVYDEPGHGGACHEYQIRNIEHITGDAHDDCELCLITFQKGPIKEYGVNGISGEALLAIVEDRLIGFQSGSFACEANAIALSYIQSAMEVLKNRTIERLGRGVEGTNHP